METEDPTTPYNYAEQQHIMRELEQHLKDAQKQGDVARTYYTVEALEEARRYE